MDAAPKQQPTARKVDAGGWRKAVQKEKYTRQQIMEMGIEHLLTELSMYVETAWHKEETYILGLRSAQQDSNRDTASRQRCGQRQAGAGGGPIISRLP